MPWYISYLNKHNFGVFKDFWNTLLILTSNLFEEYLICLQLVLLFVIRLIASFKAVPIRLYNTLPSVFPHSISVKLDFGLVFCALVLIWIVSILSHWSYSGSFNLWNSDKTQGAGRTVRRLAMLDDIMFCLKYLSKVRWTRLCIIVVKPPLDWKCGLFLPIASRNI